MLRLERRPTEALFAVADDGPGIAVDDQARIFERFYRSETTTPLRNEGAGLGLPIARAMVELHGGRLWVDSTPGEGTTFWIVLPLDGAA
jgi:signal transduction histidine kinase